MPAETNTPLEKARSRAQRVSTAGNHLRATWGDIRRRLTIGSLIIPGLPLAGLMARLAERSFQTDPSVFAMATLVAVPVLTNLVIRIIEHLQRVRHAPDAAYQAVLDKCVDMGPMPAPIDAALDQAVEAYFSLRKLGEEPDWKRVGYPMDDHLRRASERVVELLDWGRRLAFIGDRLEKTRGSARETPEFRETQAHYLAQCAQIAAAASAFSRVEAKVTLAYAALSASAARDSLAAGQLQELTATFEALTEVLSDCEGGSRIVPPAEEPQMLIQRH
jgi:hypothetical protein